MLCPKCNKPLSENSRFCKYCGSKNETSCIACGHNNPKDAEFCAKCGTRMNDLIYCEKCGVANFPDEDFCRECSASIKHGSGPVAKAVLPPRESMTPIKKVSPAQKLAFLLLLFVLSGGGIALLMHNAPSPMIVVTPTTPNPIPGPGAVVTPPVTPPVNPLAPIKQRLPLKITAELDKNFYLPNQSQEAAVLLRVKAGEADILKDFYRKSDKKIVLSSRPEHFIIAADISGSMMRDNRMDALKKLIKNIIKNMKKSDQATLFTYNNSAETVFSAYRPDEKAKAQDNIFSLIDNIAASGGTNFEDALKATVKAVQTQKSSNTNKTNYIQRIILISDGRPTVGKTAVTDLEKTIQPVFNNPDIRMVTIAMGTEVNSYLLARLSRTFGGQYIYNDSLIRGESINIFSNTPETNPGKNEMPRITDIDIHVTPLEGSIVTKAVLGTMRSMDDKACFYLESLGLDREKTILYKMKTPVLRPGKNKLFSISGSYVIRFKGERKTFKIDEQTVHIETPETDNSGHGQKIPMLNSSIVKIKKRVQAANKLIAFSKELDNNKTVSSNEIDDLQELSKEDAAFFKGIQQSVKENKENPSRASRKVHYRGMQFLNQQ